METLPRQILVMVTCSSSTQGESLLLQTFYSTDYFCMEVYYFCMEVCSLILHSWPR